MDKYITKSDAVFAACKVLDKLGGCSMGPFCPDSGCKEVREVIDSVPAADVVEVRHGKWQFEFDENMTWCTKAICTSCKQVVANNVDLTQTWGKDLFLHDNLYCLHCGAKMDGGQDE